MAVKSLNNRVVKTVLVGSVKLAAPANRIGTGFGAIVDHPPATFLSLGQFPLPRLPEPDLRSRREVPDMWSMPSAADPASSAGSVSGAMACRLPLAADRWANRANPRARTEVTATTATTLWQTAGTSRASYPGSVQSPYRLGCDCQSPDRLDDKAGHQTGAHGLRHRTATPATKAKK